jgi:hypothetical protein
MSGAGYMDGVNTWKSSKLAPCARANCAAFRTAGIARLVSALIGTKILRIADTEIIS